MAAFKMLFTSTPCRKTGFLPSVLSRFFAGETTEGEQPVIYQQPARQFHIQYNSPAGSLHRLVDRAVSAPPMLR